ncbi:phosphotransferase [Patescibacteria group bacterium]|nr:phosphotransferase [Patescibacteria group bacterium]
MEVVNINMRVQEINKVIKRYYPPLGKVKVIRKFKGGFINDVYLLEEVNGEKLVFKIRKGEKYSDLKRNSLLLSYLDQAGIPVTPLILTKDKMPCVMLNNNNSCEVYKYIDGKSMNSTKISLHRIRDAANLFSKLDRKLEDAGKIFSTFPTGKILTTKELLKELYHYKNMLKGSRSRKKMRLYSFACKTIETLEKNLYKFDFHNLPYQITHGNLSDNNIIVDKDGRIQCIIDWDNIRKRPRIHSIVQQALTVSGGYNTKTFISRFVQYLSIYSCHNPIFKEEIISILDFLTYRSLNRIWIFQHYIDFGQEKSLKAISKLTTAERWLRNNHDLLDKKLKRLPFR